MTRVIFNADDFGYSEAVSLGIIKAHCEGMIKTTSIMINMDSAEFAVNLAKQHPDLFIGQHSNIVVGRPCCKVCDVPSLVDENGYFNTKQRLKNGLSLNREEIRLEIRAQAERFKVLIGHYPFHIEGHAIRDTGLFYGIKTVATELGVHYTDIEMNLDGTTKVNMNNTGYEIPTHPDKMYYQDTVTIDYWLKDWGNLLKKELVEMHTHPGYIDQYLLDHSSYSIKRAKEVEIACSNELKEWSIDNKIEFITFADLKKTNY